ncbi:hypothetical protein EBB79_19470 [Parasedimentitalea marina]|uniref:Uncharacterized protein n=1 Tax=Parasedimentitalea marina TaxID=2483033 RepID=A0A3T0N730_9RHOB|nr:hypothetical protein EBB79_19470 [Parasedimentitalea marina]
MKPLVHGAGRLEFGVCGEFPGDAHWVGAVERGAEGSYEQLPLTFCIQVGRRFANFAAVLWHGGWWGSV